MQKCSISGLSSFKDLSHCQPTNFPFGTWTIYYSPWGSKKQNGLKKFMQVEVDVECMKTNFGGRGLSSFGDFAPFCLPSKMAKISLQTIIVHGGQKIESAQNIHASRGCCEMHANHFWQVWLLQYRSYGSLLLAFKNCQNFHSDHGLQSMGVKKQNRLKKFMQVEVDVKCMETNFGGCGFFGIGVMAPYCLPYRDHTHIRHYLYTHK